MTINQERKINREEVGDLIVKLQRSMTLEQIDRHKIVEWLRLLLDPLPLRLLCPTCGTLHVDEGAFTSKPHHTHACQRCGEVWRPAIRDTVGVRFLPGFKNATPEVSLAENVDKETDELARKIIRLISSFIGGLR